VEASFLMIPLGQVAMFSISRICATSAAMNNVNITLNCHVWNIWFGSLAISFRCQSKR